jgi:ABC-type transport system involved in cytochrome c biogenesis permease subunit
MNIRLLSLLFLFLIPSLAQSKNLDLSSLENLAIQENGRSKPFVVFAVENLQVLYGKTSWKDEQTQKTFSAMEVLADLAWHPENWVAQKLIRVDHLKLKSELELPRTEKYFSYAQLVKSERLQELLQEVLAERRKKNPEKLSPLLEAARSVGAKMDVFEKLAGGRAWAMIPHPSDPVGGAWSTLPEAAQRDPSGNWTKGGEHFQKMEIAYREANQAAFDQSAQALKEEMRKLSPTVYPKEYLLQLEQAYLQVHPFRLAWIVYLLALVLLALSEMKGRAWGYQGAWLFCLLGFSLQLGGFIARTLISGRAPVTNMYETVIWLGFGVMFFALVFEAIYRCRYFMLGAIPVAVVSLILADSLPAVLNSGINPLVPVLRHNFWLSTHVLSITSSYAALALALGVGHIVLGKVILGKSVSSALYQYLYRSIQIGVLLLAVGTILGGIWANYSWGRFWDWDPKETWALIALLSYLAVLHGRLAGWWGGFGLAVGSVLGFLAVVMAWYGVNFVLGQGLHSYGFGAGGLEYVIGFAIFELIFVALALWLHRSRPQFDEKRA